MTKPPICIPIDAGIVGELFLRLGPDSDIAGTVENILTDFLERTADESYWKEAYYRHREEKEDAETLAAQYGDPKDGYHWTPIFLPNGTQLCMEYKQEKEYAFVKFGKIEYKGKHYSPSELASAIANNTTRNAWRDLLIMRPKDADWILADDLRRRRMGK